MLSTTNRILNKSAISKVKNLSRMAEFTNHIDSFIYSFNKNYEAKHKNYEDNFWATKMNLSGNSSHDLARTKSELDAFLGDKEMLNKIRILRREHPVSSEQERILNCFEKTLQCYIVEDPAVVAQKDKINKLEAELAQSRNKMNLGYVGPDGNFTKASSVQLRNLMRTSEDSAIRTACLEGLRSIGPFVAEKFCDIVKLRNSMARSLGFVDFYDMKVTQAEGFNKAVLFEILDKLERDTRPLMETALRQLAVEKGEAALQPENIGYFMSGDISKLKDPYFPFEDAVDIWARSFAALGISYRGSTMHLDLCDREGKYSNGFCHWPQPAWQSQTGEWVPSRTNFTSLASPKSVGSGNTALVTLMHEGGHAAHFANVVQGSPLFSQERAPTSVAYAENQSMFLDSLVSDADWMARYAYSREGEPLPWHIIEQEIRSTHPYEVLALRSMLAVPYFEKRLYELPIDDITPERVLLLAADVEIDIQGMRASRPLFSVPHILADESAAYYHGYVLAEMSVHQTRKHFETKYGYIVDNPNVGKDLAEVYWYPGNSIGFLSLVKQLTGSDLSSAAWVEKLEISVEDQIRSEQEAYIRALATGPRFSKGTDVDLNMRIVLVHGDQTIADSSINGLSSACVVYKQWVSTL